MNNLLFLDFEATGVDPHNDRIVEFSFMTDIDDIWTERVNPGVPIPAEASAVHGITDANVADRPRFGEFAGAIQALIDGRTLVGYNCRRYDSVILDAELRRAGKPGLTRDEHGKIIQPEIDLFALWQLSEVRTLAGAAKRFAGVDLEGAHSAEADTVVLPSIFAGMLTAFGLEGNSDEELCAMCIPEGALDRDGKFIRREDGVVVFNFSNSKGQPVLNDPGLLRWMLGKDFSEETKAYAREFLDEIYRPAPAVAEQGGFF